MNLQNTAITFLRTTALATLSILAASAVSAAAQIDGAALQTDKPRLIQNAYRVGSVPDSQRVTISLYLKFRNTEDLDQLLDDQQNPDSARYQKFLTPDEFHAKYSPLSSDIAKVKTELNRMGFKIVDAPAGGLYITAQGTVGQVKSGFHVTQELYSKGGKTLRSHAEAPVIPASIAPLVLHVAGLDDSKKLFHGNVSTSFLKSAKNKVKQVGSLDDPPYSAGYVRSPCNVDYAKPVIATVTPAALTTTDKMDFTNCGYTPAQVQQAYGVNKVKANGKGIRVGLVDLYLPTTLERDLNQYSSLHGLPQVNEYTFQIIAPPSLNTSSEDTGCDPTDWSVESTLDVEAAHVTAPGADIVYFGDACNEIYPLPMQAMYGAIDNRLADVLSGSFGGPELDFASSQEDADNQEFKQAAAVGITVMFSSGDSADYLSEQEEPIAMVTWPASSPWVTAVGGTSLLLNKNGANSKLEAGWGTYIMGAYGDMWTGPFQILAEGWEGWSFDSGSGGGTSFFMPQPSYQAGVVPKKLSETINTTQTASLKLGTPYRVVPDVSMVADPFTGFLQGQTFLEDTPGTVDIGCTPVATPANAEYCEFPQGGTSVSSPLFAGVMAVVNSARLSIGKPPVGFFNPALYKLPVGSNGSTAAIWDVSKPSQPFALLEEDLDDYGDTGIGAIGINMDPTNQNSLETTWIVGGDSKLMTSPGYDNVTGLGTPWLPGLISALAPGSK
jgi:subtilase family serine protease